MGFTDLESTGRKNETAIGRGLKRRIITKRRRNSLIKY